MTKDFREEKMAKVSIPNGRPYIGKEEAEAVVEVLSSGQIARGEIIGKFERRVADYCGVKHAVAVSSGTAALHLAALVVGLEPGKLCWTTPITFVATANCILHAGADIDFVDISPDTINIDIGVLANKLENAQAAHCLPDVIIPVHFAGQSCDMSALSELSRVYGFKIIEDASHALGGSYKGYKVGSCLFSDIAIFSFHPAKSITTGEGGMILTNDKAIYDRLVMLRHNGITKSSELMKKNRGAWYYEQQLLGSNSWLTDIQSAIGVCQMRRLDEFVRKRKELTEYYDRLLHDLPVTRLQIAEDIRSAYNLYVVRIDRNNTQATRDEIFKFMTAHGIGVQVHYIPVPAQPFYSDLGFNISDYSEARCYYNETISFPLFTAMTFNDVEMVVKTLKKAFVQR